MSASSLQRFLESLSLQEYITLFGSVFDKDTRSTARFRLWPKQAKLTQLMEKSTECCIPKARQLGISEIAAEEAVKLAMQKRNSLTLVFSKTERDAIEFLETKVRPKIVALPSLGGKITWPEIVAESKMYIRLSNNSRIICLPASNRAGASTVADHIIIDEGGGIDLQPGVSLATIYRNVYPTIEKAKGKIRIIGTSEPGSYFNQMVAEIVAGTKPIDCFFLPSSADPSRTELWRETTRRKYPSEADFLSQFPETIDDFFTVREGLIYKQYDDTEGGRHVKDFSPNRLHRLYLAYDHGYSHPAVLLEAYFDTVNDHLYVYRELVWRGKMAEDIADGIKEHLYKTNIGPYAAVADSAIFSQTGVPGPIAIFEEKGLRDFFQKCKKTKASTGLDASAAKLSYRLTEDKITIHPQCERLRHEMGSWRWNDKGDKPVDIDDDAIDCLRYIINELDAPVKERKPAIELGSYRRREPLAQRMARNHKKAVRAAAMKRTWLSL